jgi:hypothetical protein
MISFIDVWTQEVPGPWLRGSWHLIAHVDLTPAACTVQGRARHPPAALAEAVAGHGDVPGSCRRKVAHPADQEHLNQSTVAGQLLVECEHTLGRAQRRTGSLPMGSLATGEKVEKAESATLKRKAPDLSPPPQQRVL